MSGFYQCIPGSGKTWLSRHDTSFVDSDDIMGQIGLSGKAGFDELRSNPDLQRGFVERLKLAAAKRTVLCNFDPAAFDLPCTQRFSYKPEDYYEHLRIVGRQDLLSNFTQKELMSWAHDYKGKDNVTWLQAGEYLSDYLSTPQT